MADIVHRIGIHSPVTEVYKALTTLKGLSAGGPTRFKERNPSVERSNSRFVRTRLNK